MHPSIHARQKPDHIAYKMIPSGEAVTYAELDRRSNQCAHLLRGAGLGRGDVIAVLLENHPRYFEIAWGAERSGLYYVCLSSRLSAEEAAFILADSGARLLMTSQAMLGLAREAVAGLPGISLFVIDGPAEGCRDYLAERDALPATPVADESHGAPMLYSSGTTGRPKGIKLPLPETPIDAIDPLARIAIDRFGFGEDMTYLSPAPLYHAAPLRWTMCVQKCGGTVIVMEKFDAEEALRLIEAERVTHSQWVPTHFIRMLKLPEETRARYDLSSHRLTFHAAAPCPVPVKEEMIRWWGPIIHEFYSGTEFNGLTAIGPDEWLAHKGSVGRAVLGTIHIMSEEGEELPPGREGLVWFEGGTRFAYHNDPERTREAYNDRGWSTLGDIGRVDEEGFLYLTDRQSFMIISGGVNIYPQEIENLIVTHPRVADVAVIGAPDEDLGERLVAVVQPLDWADAGEPLAGEIRELVLARLGRIKLPRQIDFMPELPRHPTGKLYKRLLRDQYRERAARG